MSKEAIKAVVDCLIKAMLERPDDFDIGELTMTDNKTQIQYWINNGWLDYGIYQPYKLRFGFTHGRRFGRALVDLKAYQTIKKTRGEPATATA